MEKTYKRIETMEDLNLYLYETSFHDVIIYTSAKKLTEIIGRPEEIGDVDDKTQLQWSILITDNKGTFGASIYDWKEYYEFDWNENIEFHIGTKTKNESKRAFDFLNEKLSKKSGVTA